MAKLSTLDLDELYARPKKSKAVEIAIIAKENFTQINPRYCDNVCTLKCKTYSQNTLLTASVDILIIQDHQAPAGKFDRREGQQESIQKGVLDFVCREAGFAGLTYRLVSLSKCKASNEDYPNGKPPTQTKLTKCYPYLRQEILNSKPKVIISLGTAVTKAIGLNKHSNTGNRGEVAFSEFGPVVVTLHPKITTYIRQNARGSAGMWGPDYLTVMIRDFKKAASLVRKELVYTPATLHESIKLIANEQIFVAKSIEQVREYYGWMTALPENQVVSFDTETNGLDPLATDARLLTIQFGWKDIATGKFIAIVIPLWHRKNDYYNPDEAWDIVSPWLTSPQPKVGHNAKFDILYIYWTKNIRVANVIFDTMLLLHSINSGVQGTYSLKMAAWDYLLDMGFAGYENDLGDLKKLQREKDKEYQKALKLRAEAAIEEDLETSEDDEIDLSEFADIVSDEEMLAIRLGLESEE